MATATQESRVAGEATISPSGAPPVSPGSEPRDAYTCPCGHRLRVFGGGRHRVYFETADTRLDEPVMNRVCPDCGRGLPGKNGP